MWYNLTDEIFHVLLEPSSICLCVISLADGDTEGITSAYLGDFLLSTYLLYSRTRLTVILAMQHDISQQQTKSSPLMSHIPYCTAIFPSESLSSSHWNLLFPTLVFPTSFHTDWETEGDTGATKKATWLVKSCTSFSHTRPPLILLISSALIQVTVPYMPKEMPARHLWDLQPAAMLYNAHTPKSHFSQFMFWRFLFFSM